MSSAATHVISMDEELTFHCIKSESEQINSVDRGNVCNKTIGRLALVDASDRADDLAQIQTAPCCVENEEIKQEMVISDTKDSGTMQSQYVDQMYFEDCKDFVNDESVVDYHVG